MVHPPDRSTRLKREDFRTNTPLTLVWDVIHSPLVFTTTPRRGRLLRVNISLPVSLSPTPFSHAFTGLAFSVSCTAGGVELFLHYPVLFITTRTGGPLSHEQKEVRDLIGAA